MDLLQRLGFLAGCVIAGAALPVLPLHESAPALAAPVASPPEVVVRAEGSRTEGSRAEPTQPAIVLTSAYPSGGSAAITYDVVDARGAVILEAATSATFAKAGASFAQPLDLPPSLADGAYVARVRAVALPASARDGERETVVTQEVAFRITRGAIAWGSREDRARERDERDENAARNGT